MKKGISFAVIFTALLLIVSVVISMNSDKKVESENTVKGVSATADELKLPKGEMRGLWVSYISLDMQDTDKSFESFKVKFDNILSEAIKTDCNTIIVQVRPFCDALYKSEIFPSSHVLSGVQGVSAGYDALEYMCNASHSKGLYLHAWINPYRVRAVSTPSSLANSNPYCLDNTMGVELDSGIYLNPAKRSVRKLIVDGVTEIVENYDVDGIQFDDYFYASDCGSFDAEDYNAYKKSCDSFAKAMTFDKWRQNNVNLLIAEVYRRIKNIDSTVVFGISPQGNIQNDYSLFADVKSWCASYGYADYICPQMYYSIENPTLSFEESLKEWNELEKHGELKVYIGLGAYKAGTDADSGTWAEKEDELASQLKLIRKYGYDGYMIYDYSALISDKAEKELEAFREVI
ncbi:MAG: glycoside hydrolase family 10 protein [Ruminococcus sp.]